MFIAFVNLLIQGISFLVQNFIARNLGQARYGFFGLLQTDYSIFCSLADFGMSTLILAFFGSRATTGRLFNSVLQLRLICTLAAAILMLVFTLTVRHNHPVFLGELILTFGLLFQHAFFDWYFICGKFWKKLLISKILHSISYALIMGFTLLYLEVDRIELIALAMVLAAIPAFFFGVTQAFNISVLKLTKRSLQFVRLMVKAGIPYALSSFATFAYLPAGLYIADKFATPEFLSSYNYSHKILILCSGIMVHFISSTLVTQHISHDKEVHLKDILIFTAFIAVCTIPLWLFPKYFLQILFFAVDWQDTALTCSGNILRILSLSLIFQAMRMSLISSLLKNKATWTYAILVTSAGAFNILACTLAGSFLSNSFIPLFAISGDIVLNLSLFTYFFRTNRIRV